MITNAAAMSILFVGLSGVFDAIAQPQGNYVGVGSANVIQARKFCLHGFWLPIERPMALTKPLARLPGWRHYQTTTPGCYRSVVLH